jgi:hypothetical protein
MKENMIEFGNVNILDNFLNMEEHNIVCSEFELIGFHTGAGEVSLRNKGIPIRGFLYKELIEVDTLRNIFQSKIEYILNKKIEVLRCYGNGQSHSQTGWIHNDDSSEDLHGSIVYYPNLNWLPIFGGNLIFVNEQENDVIHSIYPKGNRAVLFNSKMKHYATDPTAYCLDLRVSIALKFKVLKNDSQN